MTTDDLLAAKAAVELVPLVSARNFAAGDEGYIEAAPAGELKLPPVDCGEIPPRLMPIQIPVNMPGKPPGFLSTVRYPRMTVSRIRNVLCLPGGVMVPNRQTVLLESFSAPWEADYHKHLDQHGAFWRLQKPADDAVRADGPILFIDYQHMEYFGHFIADVLPRCWAIDYCRAFFGMDRLRVLLAGTVPPFIPALLCGFGLRPEQLILSHGPVLCTELIVAAKAFQLQEFTSPVAASVWRRLRDSLDLRQGGPERIYVSRRKNPTRPLYEEQQVEALLAGHGFTIIHPQELDIRLQVSLFANARLIAGCSGSNMFNIAFQRKAQAVLILVSPLLVHYSEQFLHAGHAASLTYQLGHVSQADLASQPGYVHAPWHIDITKLAGFIPGWIAANS